MVHSSFEKFYVRTGVDYAKLAAKGSGKVLEKKDDDLWLQKILEYVRTSTGTKITKTISTHYKDIQAIARKMVQAGIDEGFGMDVIARNIMKGQGEIDLWKALRIARTEVVAASSIGTKMGAETLVGKKSKVWVSTFDDRSRGASPKDEYDHMSMDGQKVGIEDMFISSNGNKLEFPGDPNCTDPGEIINCRCGYEVIVESEYF